MVRLFFKHGKKLKKEFNTLENKNIERRKAFEKKNDDQKKEHVFLDKEVKTQLDKFKIDRNK